MIVNSSNPIVGPVAPHKVIEIDANAGHAHPIHTGLHEYPDPAEVEADDYDPDLDDLDIPEDHNTTAEQKENR